MALNADDVARLASLARIDLTEEERERLAPQIDIILSSVASVSEVAGEDIEPTSHPLPITNVMRPDERRNGLAPEAVLANAPDIEDGQFRVPSILGGEQ